MSKKFLHIFWFLAGLTALTILYNFCITFLHIPKENIRFADTAQGFLLGSGIGAALGYLVQGTPDDKKRDDIPKV